MIPSGDLDELLRILYQLNGTAHDLEMKLNALPLEQLESWMDLLPSETVVSMMTLIKTYWPICLTYAIWLGISPLVVMIAFYLFLRCYRPPFMRPMHYLHDIDDTPL